MNKFNSNFKLNHRLGRSSNSMFEINTVFDKPVIVNTMNESNVIVQADIPKLPSSFSIEPIIEHPMTINATENLLSIMQLDEIDDNVVENEILLDCIDIQPKQSVDDVIECDPIEKIYEEPKEFFLSKDEILSLSIKPKFKDIVKISYKNFLKKNIPSHWNE